MSPVFYLDFLQRLHERLRPRTYLEIGIGEGDSLALSRCRSVGVDPEFVVTSEILAPVSLVRATSDDYFAGLEERGTTPFDGDPVDVAFIDGLHHFEQALRDFVHVERYATASSVVVFDDVFPRRRKEAARERRTLFWTGDVFWMPYALAKWRPDLSLLRVDTQPTGLLLVTGLDPASTVLAASLDAIEAEYVRPDPQPVPRAVLERRRAMKPGRALALPVWDDLVSARRPFGDRPVGPAPGA